jgi:hypothetical protein
MDINDLRYKVVYFAGPPRVWLDLGPDDLLASVFGFHPLLISNYLFD